MRRLSLGVMICVVALTVAYIIIFRQIYERRQGIVASQLELQGFVKSLGLTDLVISTEARYTRHLTISDRVVISMDHPGGIDHFPSSAFFAPSAE